MRRLVSVLVALAALSSAALAQGPRPLTMPDLKAVSICRQLSAADLPMLPASVGYEFRFLPPGSSPEAARAALLSGGSSGAPSVLGPPQGETFLVHYDSSGRHLGLRRLYLGDTGGETVIVAPDGVGGWAGVRFRLAADDLVQELPVDSASANALVEKWTTPLDASELVMVDSILTTLWARRCGAGETMRVATQDTMRADREGRLTANRMAQLAPNVHSLRVEPRELRVAIGEPLDLRSRLRVVALDSLGTELGVIPMYDAVMRVGSFVPAPGGGLMARAEGTAEYVVFYPRTFWRHGDPEARPQATVLIHVTPE